MATRIRNDQYLTVLAKLFKSVFESCKRFLCATRKKLHSYGYSKPAMRILKTNSDTSLSSTITWGNEMDDDDTEERKSKLNTYYRASGDCSCNGKNSSEQTLELHSPLITNTMELYSHGDCENPDFLKLQNSHFIRADNELDEFVDLPITEDLFIYDELDSEFNQKFTFF